MEAPDFRIRYSPHRKIAVTGSTGYIGSLATAEGFQLATLESLPTDTVVVHLASTVQSSRTGLISNLNLDSYLSSVVNERLAGLVYASTNNVYPLGEECAIDSPVRPTDYYSASKVFGETVVCLNASKPVCIVRLADVFGKGQKHGNLFRAIEKSVKSGNSLPLYGAGEKRRSYIYAHEAVSYLLFLAAQIVKGVPVPQVANLCYEDAPSTRELIQEIADKSNLEIQTFPVTSSEQKNVRTMVPGPFDSYQFKWRNMSTALDHYIAEIREQRSGANK